MTRSLSPKCVTHYDTFTPSPCKDVSGLCEAFIRKIYCFKGAVNLSDADKSPDELRYVRVAVVFFIPSTVGGGSYYIKRPPSLIYDISAFKMFLIFQKKLKKLFCFFCGTTNGTAFLFATGYGTVIEPNVKFLAQSVSAFLAKQKSRHIDSTNSGKTFHPIAQFALKLCNGLKFKHRLSVCFPTKYSDRYSSGQYSDFRLTMGTNK